MDLPEGTVIGPAGPEHEHLTAVDATPLEMREIISTEQANHCQFLRDEFRERANELATRLKGDMALQTRFRSNGFITTDPVLTYRGPRQFRTTPLKDLRSFIDRAQLYTVWTRTHWWATHRDGINARIISGSTTEEDLHRMAGHLFTLVELHDTITEAETEYNLCFRRG